MYDEYGLFIRKINYLISILSRSDAAIQADIAYFKQHYPDCIMMGSIMADCRKGWETLVGALEDAGADIKVILKNSIHAYAN